MQITIACKGLPGINARNSKENASGSAYISSCEAVVPELDSGLVMTSWFIAEKVFWTILLAFQRKFTQYSKKWKGGSVPS